MSLCERFILFAPAHYYTGEDIGGSGLAEIRPEAVNDLAVAYATLQCADLLARGAPAIHFYALNKSPATRAVVSALLAARPWEMSSGARFAESAQMVEGSARAAG